MTDPRDGSLYIFTSKKDGLKKFPYTIAELVSASPSKSSDGFLYTGDKKDQWLAVDYRNGNKLDTLTAETLASKVSNTNKEKKMNINYSIKFEKIENFARPYEKKKKLFIFYLLIKKTVFQIPKKIKN